MTFDLTFAILKEELDDIVPLEEAELEDGVRAALQLTHNLARSLGSQPRWPRRGNTRPAQGRKVACVITGGNIDARTLRRASRVGGAPS